MVIDTAEETASAPRATHSAGVPTSLLQQIFTLLGNHIKLAILESQFEFAQATRRITLLAICAVLALTLYVLVQVAILNSLVRLGLPLWGACLSLGAFYGLLMSILFSMSGKRDPRAGVPFEASQAEWKRSTEWMRKRFF